MQYTSKIALLAVALFGTSALAAPFAGEAEYDVEAREVDNELSAREFYDMYLEARADPSLDARDVESLDLDAREYLEYLEAREAASVSTPPQTPLTSTPSTPIGEAHQLSHATKTGHVGSKHELVLTKHQKVMRHRMRVAEEKFQSVEFYHHALLDKESKYHHFAVVKYLSKPKNLKKALANTDSPYHKAAKRILHHRKAKVYLADKKHFKKALTHKHNKYHKDAVKLYLSHGDHYEYALTHKKAHFHRAAVHEYLLDTKTRHQVLSDPSNEFYKQALKLEKKIRRHHHHHHHHHRHSETASSTSSTATSTPTALQKA